MYTYFPGATRITEGMAPNMKNTSYTITGTITVPASGAEGMIVTQGGWFGGNALYLLNGKPVFAYARSHYPEHKYKVEAPEALPAGRHDIRVDFAYDGGDPGSGGTATIFVDNAQVGIRPHRSDRPGEGFRRRDLRRRRRQWHTGKPRLRRAIPLHRRTTQSRSRTQAIGQLDTTPGDNDRQR